MKEKEIENKDYIFKTTATKFTFIFSSLIYIIYNTILSGKMIPFFTTHNITDYVGLIGYYFIGLFLTIALFSILAHRYLIKGFAIFIIIASAASTYVILKFNVAIDRSMIMNIWYTNTSESLTLFTPSMIPLAIVFILLPIYLVIKTKIVFDGFFKHLIKSIATFVLTIALGLGIAYADFDPIHLAGNRSEKYIVYQLVPVNFLVEGGSAIKHAIKDRIKFKAKKIPITGKRVKDDNLIVVLAIGEAARQLNFNLYGYKRVETNPNLSKIKDLHHLNGIAKYGSTIWALPQILSRDDLKLPSITSHFDIPTSCYSNFQMYGNCGTVPEVMVSNCGHGGQCYDEDVIPYIEKDIKSYKSGSKLIVVHIGAGSHGPLYATRYPKEFQKFNPQCKSPDVKDDCTKEELFNSYDNTILYVDNVVSKIIKKLDASKKPYLFIYLSDHGESLLENGRVFHGMPPGIALPYEQAHIPLLVKSSIPIKIIKKDEYKQPYVYDTILDLFDIDTDVKNKDDVFIKKIEK